MAHHLDSPIARQDVRLDITDMFVFRGEIGTAFVINVCHSIAGPIPTPGYHPEGMYEFKIDLNGDAIEELTYRITFDERDPHGRQRFALRRIRGTEAVDPHAGGTAIAQGIIDEVITAAGGLRIWASPQAIRSGSRPAQPARCAVGLGFRRRSEPHPLRHRRNFRRDLDGGGGVLEMWPNRTEVGRDPQRFE